MFLPLFHLGGNVLEFLFLFVQALVAFLGSNTMSLNDAAALVDTCRGEEIQEVVNQVFRRMFVALEHFEATLICITRQDVSWEGEISGQYSIITINPNQGQHN